MNYDLKKKAARKAAYLKSTTQRLQPKSFYDKHHLTTNIVNFASYLLSAISITLGITAIFALVQMFFGIDTTLLGFFEVNPVMAWLMLFSAGLFLFLIEFIKHKFNTEALFEQERQTDDLGKIENRIAFTAIVFSLIISAWGGMLVADELAGTKKTAKLTALNAEYNPLIAEAKANKTAYFEAKKWKGKLSDKNVGEFNRLSLVVTDLETAFRNAKTAAGVSDGFVAATEVGTWKMAALLGGSQLLVELLLYFCLWWNVYFQARCIDEEKKLASTPSQPYKLPKAQNGQLQGIGLNQVANSQPTNPIGFFNRVSSQKPQPKPQKSQSTQGVKTVVAQQPQQKATKATTKHTIEIVDLEKERKRVREYIPRLRKSYTDNNFESIRNDVKKLAEYGYKVTIGKRISVKKTIALGSQVMVIWNENNSELILKYSENV